MSSEFEKLWTDAGGSVTLGEYAKGYVEKYGKGFVTPTSIVIKDENDEEWEIKR